MSCCIIHIGMLKTGTTSIQQSLKNFENERFVYFVQKSGQANHSRAIFRFLESRGSGHPKSGEKTRTFQDVDNQVKKSLTGAIQSLEGRDLIISGEGLIALEGDELRRLRKFFEELNVAVKIVAYIRPPSAFMTSVFLQRLKTGTRINLNPDSDYANYRNNFSKFDEVFGADNVHLWRFDPKTFANGCVVQDFCQRLGIEVSVEDIVRVNESLSREAASLLFIYRKLSGDLVDRPMRGEDYRYLINRLIGVGTSKFRFSPELIKPILSKYSDDIKWMEDRIGAPLNESLGEKQPGDICSELDLLEVGPETVADLKALVGDSVPLPDNREPLEEVAQLVQALRCLYRPEDQPIDKFHNKSALANKRASSSASANVQITVMELVTLIENANPGLLQGISKLKVAEIIRNCFPLINKILADRGEGDVDFPDFGKFNSRNTTRRKDGEEVAHSKIVCKLNIGSTGSKGENVLKPRETKPSDVTVKK